MEGKKQQDDEEQTESKKYGQSGHLKKNLREFGDKKSNIPMLDVA